MKEKTNNDYIPKSCIKNAIIHSITHLSYKLTNKSSPTHNFDFHFLKPHHPTNLQRNKMEFEEDMKLSTKICNILNVQKYSIHFDGIRALLIET